MGFKHIKDILKRLPILKTKPGFMDRLNKKIDTYIPGVHCDNEHCYACATQRHNCNRLIKLDKM